MRMPGYALFLGGAALVVGSFIAGRFSGPVETDSDYKVFLRSHMPVYREAEVPQGIPMPEGYEQRGRAIDLDSDGTEELEVTGGCGSGGCWGAVYQLRNGRHVKIADTLIGMISDETNDRFKDFFATQKTYLPWSGFTDVTHRYRWDGTEYREIGRFLSPDTLNQTINFTKTYLKDETNPSRRQEAFGELSNLIGPLNAFQMLVLSNTPPNVPIPEDPFDRERLIYDLSRERGINLSIYEDDPEGLRRFLFGTPTFVQPTTAMEFGIAFAASLGKSIQRELGHDPYTEYVQVLRKSNGYVDDYINRTNNIPDGEVLTRLLQQGAAASIYEHEIPERPGIDSTRTTTSVSPYGTTRTQTFDPTAVVGDPNFRGQSPQQLPPIEERTRQLVNQGRNQAGQAIDRVGEALGNLLKPQEKK